MSSEALLLVVAVGILVIQLLFFAFAAAARTDKLTDLAYGMTFVAVALFLYMEVSSQQVSQLYIVIAVVVWGIRLAGYLFIRILSMKTDKRFDGMRENVRSFAKFWLLQAVTIFVVSLPVVFALHGWSEQAVVRQTIVGGWIFLLGRLLESIADRQKYMYKQNNPHHRVDRWLWSLSRHPNYFGEMLVWRWIFLMSMPFLSWWERISIASPVWISLLLLFVSGIPLLEKSWEQRYSHDSAWQDYKKHTRLLVPLPRKK